MSDACNFGIFEIDSGLFAVDVTCVSEVVPFELHSDFLSENDAVIGSLDLRGWTVPVIDLSTHIRGQRPVDNNGSILVVRSKERLLGIAIRSVVGMEDVPANAIAVINAQHSLLSGSFVSASLNKGVTILSTERLLSDQALPSVPAPPAAINHRHHVTAGEKRTVMLTTVGKRLIAFLAEDIFSTLTETTIVDNVHHSNSFLGEVEHQNKRIPILDLGSLVFDQPRTEDVAKLPTVIIHANQCQIGLCVDSIIDVTEFDYASRITNISNSYMGKNWISSLIPTSAIQSDALSKFDNIAPLAMLISASSISQLDEIKGVSLLCRDLSSQDMNKSRQTQLSKEKQGLYFDMGAPVLVDITSVSEILRWNTPIVPLTDQGYLFGMIKVESEAIPIYDFRPLFACEIEDEDDCAPSVQFSDDAKRILLVRDEAGAFGYCVNKLLDVVAFQPMENAKDAGDRDRTYSAELNTVYFFQGEKRHYANQLTSEFLRRQISPPQ
ncbi:chemotaxis protein CheW [Alteromonas lipolytica]|uniref:CheW-like domain-containing protein n=1 Tax=Alteromonas lipolytica TaxID=1856405 RepID=A0A1E8FK33_9ALTE|nr:chemotaxis protein CheW [Alteromonas lipolytica]OFI36282.1 hypothetical protein BFC17_09185 [Alteromonas lipolytica]GGF79390.1 hypothetical protein GCM10011338_34680 [Alteromonas lipolytica]